MTTTNPDPDEIQLVTVMTQLMVSPQECWDTILRPLLAQARRAAELERENAALDRRLAEEKAAHCAACEREQRLERENGELRAAVTDVVTRLILSANPHDWSVADRLAERTKKFLGLPADIRGIEEEPGR